MKTVVFAVTPLVCLVAATPALADVSPHVQVSVPIDLETATVSQLDNLLATGQTTSANLTQAYLQRIQALSNGGPKLDAVRGINPDALNEARAADATLASGVAHGPLLGIPVLIKDNIDLAGTPTTAGSVALTYSYPSKDAPIVTDLKNAGAVVLGKANLTEFANFLTAGMPGGYSSLGGQVVNAYDYALNPSGSSAGPAVAASTGLAPLTIGTETSGSILSPSTTNEDVGIKPTVGLVSRTGILPISHTQDTAGPITKTVADAAAELTAIVSKDSGDPATSSDPLLGHNFMNDLSTTALAGTRLGVVTTRTCRDALCDGTGGVSGTDYSDTSQRPTTVANGQALYDNALAAMTAQGAVLVPVTVKIPFIPLPTAANPAQAPSVLTYDFKADLNSYLSTLPAGSPIQNLQDIIDYNNTHKVDQNAIMYGQTQAIASQAVDLNDPTTIMNEQANRARDIAQSKTAIDAAVSANNVSALIYSAAGSAGIGAKAQYPSIAVPAGFYQSTTETSAQHPYDISFLGQAYTEPSLIGYAYSYEQATHLRKPPSQVNPALMPPTASLPEAPYAVLLPLLALGAGVPLVLRRRRKKELMAASAA